MPDGRPGTSCHRLVFFEKPNYVLPLRWGFLRLERPLQRLWLPVLSLLIAGRPSYVLSLPRVRRKALLRSVIVSFFIGKFFVPNGLCTACGSRCEACSSCWPSSYVLSIPRLRRESFPRSVIDLFSLERSLQRLIDSSDLALLAFSYNSLCNAGGFRWEACRSCWLPSYVCLVFAKILNRLIKTR